MPIGRKQRLNYHNKKAAMVMNMNNLSGVYLFWFNMNGNGRMGSVKTIGI